MTARRIELVAAVACAALAVFGAAFALFAPTVTIATETELGIVGPDGTETPVERTSTTESRSLVEDGVEPAAIVYFIIMVGLGVLVPALAFAHGRSPATRRSTPIWIAGGLMLLLALLAGFSVGLFFLPAALAAIVTAAAATGSAGQPAHADVGQSTPGDHRRP